MVRKRAGDVSGLIDRLAAAESAFVGTEFLAPVLRHRPIRVRIQGIVCTLRVEGEPAEGWFVLRALALDRAAVDRPATASQVRAYLRLFSPVRLVLVSPTAESGTWLAVQANRGDRRFTLEGPVPIFLVTGAQPFEIVQSRCDGTSFWFEGRDPRRSPAIAAHLRDALRAGTPPEAIRRSSLTAEERAAYALAWKADAEARKSVVQRRLEAALAHGGAEFRSFVERPDSYVVRYRVDGVEHRSAVRKDDLTVLTAGICLAGQDRRFDLQSLVSVLREDPDAPRVGPGGMDEAMHHDAHPPG